MFKRFKRSNLNKFLGHEAASSEVVHSHAYGKVAKARRASPRPRYTPSSKSRATVPGYRDSMVGSIAQYRDRAPVLPPKNPEKDADAQSGGNMIGNRPQSAAADKGKTDSASARHRHHFIEPPKRSFHKFD